MPFPRLGQHPEAIPEAQCHPPYENHGSSAWWYMLVIPAVRRLRQEDDKLRAVTREVGSLSSPSIQQRSWLIRCSFHSLSAPGPTQDPKPVGNRSIYLFIFAQRCPLLVAYGGAIRKDGNLGPETRRLEVESGKR